MLITAPNRQIRYWLAPDDANINQLFMVEEFSGIIHLLRELDTDRPNGILNYTLQVSI